MSIEPAMKANRIICGPPFLLPTTFPSIRIFSNELSLHIKWSEYWSFSFSINPSSLDWFPLGLTGLISLLSERLSRVFSSSRVWKHQLFCTQPSLWSSSYELYNFTSYPKAREIEKAVWKHTNKFLNWVMHQKRHISCERDSFEREKKEK